MKRIFSTTFAIAAAIAGLHAEPTPSPSPAVAATPGPTPAAQETGAGPKARSAALELAGAFSNDGYKIRDGFYFGDLEPGKGVVVEVNLFAGNEYWFCAAANEPVRKISVQVYDEDGALASGQQYYDDGPKAAAGIVAPESGKYLVKITLAEGDKSQFCFLYCYK